MLLNLWDSGRREYGGGSRHGSKKFSDVGPFFFIYWSEPQDMERSWSGEFSWSQVYSSSFKLESALRSRSQPGARPGLPRDQFSGPWLFSTAEARTINSSSSSPTWSQLSELGQTWSQPPQVGVNLGSAFASWSQAPSTARPLARDLRVLIGWPFPLGFGLDGRLLLARRWRVYV